MTFVEITEKDLEEAARQGVPTTELPQIGKEITGSWNAHDILHVVGYETIADEAEVEGEEAEEEDDQERPDPKVLAGGKRK